jgi:hypothetical protein
MHIADNFRGELINIQQNGQFIHPSHGSGVFSPLKSKSYRSERGKRLVMRVIMWECVTDRLR